MSTPGEAQPSRGPNGGGGVRVVEADTPASARRTRCNEAEP